MIPASDEILSIFLFFGVGFSILLFTTILMGQRTKSDERLVQGALFLCLGVILVPPALHARNILIGLNAWQIPFRIAPFLIGPLAYVYTRQLLEQDYSLKQKKFLLPMFLFSSVTIIGLLVPNELWRHFFFEYFLVAFSTVYVLGYLLLAVFFALTYLKRSYLIVKKVKLARLVLVLMSCYSLSLIINIAGMLTHHRISHWSNGLLIVVLSVQFIISQKYPQFIRLKLHEDQARYQSALLKNLNLEEIGQQLDKLMVEEKIYLDEEISLGTLAEELGITKHQLSEYLNKHQQSNFFSFIGKYRIEEAKRMLLDEPDRGVLSIAYAVGYNSKSSFNSTFQKLVGQTPRQYRIKKINR